MVAAGNLQQFAGAPDSQNTLLQLTYRILGVSCCLALIASVALIASNVITAGQAAYIVGFALVATAFLVVVFRRQFRITVLIDDSRVLIKSPNSRESYPWEDIETVELCRDEHRRGLQALLRLPAASYVRIRLSRRPVSTLGSLVKTQIDTGTRVGIPMAFKVLQLHVANPEDLVVALTEGLSRSRSTEPTRGHDSGWL